MKCSLTGKKRHRIQTRWFSKPVLVLQVRVKREYELMSNVGNQIDIENIVDYIWRDANVEDLITES